MALRKILHYPNPTLRNIAEPVTTVDKEIQTLIADMFETMYEDNGIGLAATQIGLTVRVFVIDAGETKKNPLAFVNPVIIEQEGKQLCPEGCLSLPGIFSKISRANKVKIKAQDETGKEFILEADGLMAIVIQHELDHLNGKLFIDHLSPLKKQLLKKKLKKLHKQNL